MQIQKHVLRFTPILLLASWCAAAPDGVLLTDGKKINLPWTTTDGAGFVWDIHHNGGVQQGTNHAYGNGMVLQVQRGRHFQTPNNAGLLRGDGREVQLGPYTNNKLRVWRRIYVNPKLGYARWIDLFENTDATKPLKLNVEYQNHMGNSIRQCITTTGQAMPGPDDLRFVTADQGNNNRPAVMHVIASKRVKHWPAVQMRMNNNRILYKMTLTIPPGEMRALCFFEAQRNRPAEASELMKTFRPERELARIPESLRKIIVNIRGDVFLLGRLELPRDKKRDMIVLTDDSEVYGTIRDTTFPIETLYGKLDIPADRVMGLAVLAPRERFVQIALTDGQIVAGVLGKKGLAIRLKDGKELPLPLHRVATVAYRISPKKPARIKPTGALLVLRSGQQVRFDPAALPLPFLTEYGRVLLPPKNLRELRLAGDDTRLHQAVFRNGSVLTGLLQADTIKVPLALGPELQIPREALAGVVYPAPPVKTSGLIRVQLRNDDVLFGQILDKSLTVQTELGEVTVTPAQIKTLRRLQGAPGRVAIQLQDETTVSGTLKTPTIRFAVAPDTTLPLYVGHVVNVRQVLDKVEETKTPSAPTPVTRRRAHTRAELMEAQRREVARKTAAVGGR